jgi:AraC-like DNA-binding protein
MNRCKILKAKRINNARLNAWSDPSESFVPRILIIDGNQDTHCDFRLAFANDSQIAERQAGEEPIFPTAVKRGLSNSGYSLEHALTGTEGIEKLKNSLAARHPFQMAFVDIQMPGIGGVETVARLWQIDPSIQIVILTANGDHSCQDLEDRLGSADKVLLLKRPFESIEAVLMANTLTEKWFLRRRAALKLEQIDLRVSQCTRRLLQLKRGESQALRPPPCLADPSDNDALAEALSPSLSDALVDQPLHSQREPNEHYLRDISAPPRVLATNRVDVQFLCRTIEAVERCMTDFEFDVDALARMLFVSRRQLLRKLKTLAGCAPNVLIRRLRLKRAAQLLSSSGLTVSEITYAVGFSDLKHFRVVFREQYGISPGDYARKAEEQRTRRAA